MKTDTNLEIINGEPMMSSREIANITGKEIHHVHRDIRAMIPALYAVDNGEDIKSYAWGTSKNDITRFLVHHGIQGVIPEFDDRGYVHEFLLDRRHTEILVSGYDVKRRAAIIDRWHDLESGKAQPLIAKSAPQETSMNNDILSLARVVAEATASATMKAVIDIVGIQKYQSQPVTEPAAITTQPAQSTFDLQVSHLESDSNQSEYVLVSDLAWTCGFSDAACRRLVTFTGLPTKLTKGETGHLLVNRESFMAAAQTLLDESTPPTGKVKRWQHPEFGGFALRLKSSEVTQEAK